MSQFRKSAKFQSPRRDNSASVMLVVVTIALVASGLVVAFCTGNDNPSAESNPTLRPTFTPSEQSSATETPVPSSTAAVPGTTETAAPVETPTEESTVVPSSGTPADAVPTEAPATPKATKAPASRGPVAMRSPDYGMQAFLWWRPEVAQRDLELIRDAGFGWVKQGFAWREIEGSDKGHFDWTVTDRIVDQAESVGPNMIARLDSEPIWASGQAYPNNAEIVMSPPNNNKDFADFAGAVAKRYKGRIAAYQIWNEPNLAREWGGRAPDPAGYTKLLKAAYNAIKKADPDAIVISAGMAPTTRFDHVAMPDTEFLRRMYAAGAKPYFDALGAHGAGYKSPPEADPGQVANDPNAYNNGDPYCPGDPCRIYTFRHVEDLRQIMVDNGDADKRVVVLEFGWTMDERPDSPYHWHAVTEEQQADYFVRAYQYAKQHWQPWIGVMSLIYMPDDKWTEADEQMWWSVAAPNYPQFYPYKSYRDLAAMEK